MNKKLAIKGHSTRGKEVIELLEMLGGRDVGVLKGDHDYYVIDECENNLINFYGHNYIYCHEFVVFTLEEFLEKYPYKVGDKVHIYVQNDDIDGRYDIEAVEITSMRWNHARCKIAYKMKDINREFYKEEIKCKVVDSNKSTRVMEEKDKAKAPNLKGEDYSGKRFGYKIPDGYEFDVVVDGKIILKPIKPKYPTTYEKCCEIIKVEKKHTLEGEIIRKNNYKIDLLESFQKLFICRDAYWKIYGEEMGLDKSWEPDWNHINRKFYCIYNSKNNIVKNVIYSENKILAFPTEEMRDAFYENFKDLIEQCKELL